jgi:putative addiction module component (TIGR02574 family)
MLPESTRPDGSASPVIVSNPYSPGMGAIDSLLTQALQFPEEERWKLVAQLLRSFEPNDGDEVTDPEWDAAWAAEIDRRMRDVQQGRVELIDGDHVDAEIRIMLAAGRGGKR